MTKLLDVAEGILDAKEYLDTNLESVESVLAYAENGCDVSLSNDEAKQVLTACSEWVTGTESGDLNGTNDYYYTVKKPLLGDEATISNVELQQTVKSDISDLSKLSKEEDKAILANSNSAMQLKIKQ